MTSGHSITVSICKSLILQSFALRKTLVPIFVEYSENIKLLTPLNMLSWEL